MLTVSNYHYIRKNFDAKFPSIFGVTPEMFKNQLLLLKETGDFVSTIDLVNNKDEILSSKKNYILITFDDGLKEQYELALPILDELNIPALFFINSINYIEKKVSLVHKIHLVRSVVASEVLFENLIDFTKRKLTPFEIQKAHQFYRFDNSKSAELKYFLNILLDFGNQQKFIDIIFEQYFNENELLESFYMSTTQIQKLISRGYVGSHSHTHLPLGICDEKKIIYELETTKAYLESKGLFTMDCVSYPYGSKDAATEEVGKLAKEVGYKLGFTTNAAINYADQNPLLLNRFDCNDLIGGKNFKKYDNKRSNN